MRDSATVNLPPWGELVGEYKGISSDNDSTYLEVENLVLAFQKGSEHERYIVDQLAGLETGARIGILHTDLLKKSFLIRLISK